MATVLLKTMKFFKVPIIIPISYWFHFSNTHYYYLLWDQTQQSKPVAQPFQQTQWTHRPIRLHLLSPATRASMSSLLSLQASFTVLFLSLSLSIRISPTCMWSYFLDNYEQTWLHFGVLFYSENYLNTKSIHLHFLSLGSSSSNLSVQLQQHNKDKPTSDLSIYIYICHLNLCSYTVWTGYIFVGPFHIQIDFTWAINGHDHHPLSSPILKIRALLHCWIQDPVVSHSFGQVKRYPLNVRLRSNCRRARWCHLTLHSPD